jgi:hypothetical protein
VIQQTVAVVVGVDTVFRYDVSVRYAVVKVESRVAVIDIDIESDIGVEISINVVVVRVGVDSVVVRFVNVVLRGHDSPAKQAVQDPLAP